jgi:LEA14-like dessication related protein
MKKFLTPFLLVSLLALLGTGCSSSNTITAGLKVELTGIARAGDGTTRAEWRVVNPNVVSYLLAQSTHRVYLDGVLVGTITDKEAMALPANNHSARSTLLKSDGAAAERALTAAAAAKSASYRVDSNIVIRLFGDSTENSTLSSTGTVPVTAK